MTVLIGFLAATVGTVFFCLQLHAPRRAVLITAVMAGIGYTLFLSISHLTHSQPAAYFVATAFVAAGSEALAMLLKMPATIFMFPGVIPLVPGIGIYRTMLFLIRKDYEAFLDQGTQTLIALVAMTVAIALANEIARRIHAIAKKGATL